MRPAPGKPDVFGDDAVDDHVFGAVLHDRLLETLVEAADALADAAAIEFEPKASRST